MTAAQIPLCQQLGSFAAAPGEVPPVVIDLALRQLEISATAGRSGEPGAVLERAWPVDSGLWAAFRVASAVFRPNAIWTDPIGSTIQAVIIPALQTCGGEEPAIALAVAAEVTCRLHATLQAEMVIRHTPAYSVLGTLGAAVAVAKAGGGTADQIANSIAVAGSFACGASEMADAPAGSFLAGWVAQNGVLAGQLGLAGFTGPTSALEGQRGFFKVFAGGWNSTAAPLVEGLGRDWMLAEQAGLLTR